jgi:acyl-CoA thioesterase
MTDPHALARACADAMWKDDRASTGLGMRLEDVGPGHARLSMPVTEAMVNGHGLCHGGFIFMLADSTMAFASNSHGERAVAQHCNITYLRPAHLGDVLHADAVERTRAGRSGIYDVRVATADGTPIAEFRGHTRTLGQKFFGEETHGGT